MNRNTYKPWKFFALTILITWVTWFLAAYFSYQTGKEPIQMMLIIAGTFSPVVVGLSMIYGSGSKALKQDFPSRLLQVNRAGLGYLPTILLLLPVSLLAAIAISVLFGKSPTQFMLSELFSMSGLSGLMISIMAPTTEEIGWRSYGMDSLRSKYNLLTTSLVFTLLWVLWHVPLFFINGYYQNELWKMGIPYVLNFFLSLAPLSIIMNWLYYKTNRSILMAILFHVMAVLSAEAFRVDDATKFIQTVILAVVAAGIVAKDLAFFSAHSSPNLIGSRRSA